MMHAVAEDGETNEKAYGKKILENIKLAIGNKKSNISKKGWN